ncbi:MAG: hypothetical protein B7Z54_06215, partial [Sphingobacteriales bacterium 12-47-4]
ERVLPYVQFWKGEIAYRNNDLDNAIRFYNGYKDAGAPTNGEANANTVRYNLGYCYLRKENYPVALTFFESLSKNPALNSDPLTQDAYLRTADCYYMERNYNKAKPMYDNVVKFSWPAEDYATFQLAMLAGVKNTSEKVKLMNNLTRKFPRSGLVNDANLEIANAYLSDERFSEAIPYLDKLISGNDERFKPQAYLKSGNAFYNVNNNNEALTRYKKLVSTYPNTQEAEDAIGNIRAIYVEQGQPDEFAGFMRQAGRPLSVSTEDSLTWAAAEIQYANGNKDAALNSFGTYLQRFPTGAHALEANFYSAGIYADRKKWPEAISRFDYVAERAPNQYAEASVLQLSRISFFELKNYAQIRKTNWKPCVVYFAANTNWRNGPKRWIMPRNW